MKALSDLPNTEGFEFQAVLKDGTTTPCKVVLHPDGYHTTDLPFSTLKRWFYTAEAHGTERAFASNLLRINP
jgi:hypothetical protein